MMCRTIFARDDLACVRVVPCILPVVSRIPRAIHVCRRIRNVVDWDYPGVALLLSRLAATELAILAATDIEHGPLECLFTVDEETGLTGAFALKPGFMTGDILINLDSEDEGELFIGCAGGANTTAEFTYQPVSAPQDYFYFRVAVKGLTGGHSGDDINKGRANANKLLNRFLTQLASKYILYLCEIDGGNLHMPYLVRHRHYVRYL
jgi:Di- and tripeptidases